MRATMEGKEKRKNWLYFLSKPPKIKKLSSSLRKRKNPKILFDFLNVVSEPGGRGKMDASPFSIRPFPLILLTKKKKKQLDSGIINLRG